MRRWPTVWRFRTRRQTVLVAAASLGVGMLAVVAYKLVCP